MVLRLNRGYYTDKKVLLLLVLGLIMNPPGCKQKRANTGESLIFARTRTLVAEYLDFLKSREEFESVVPICEDMLNRLDSFGAPAVTYVPDPYLVAVAEKKGTAKTFLYTRHLERTSDFLAVRVREFWAGGQAISEVYELGPGTRSGLPRGQPAEQTHESSWSWAFAFPIERRREPTVCKDEEAWARWRNHGEGPKPPMYVAKPTDDTHVLISLIDEKGHESRAIPLTCWIVSE